MTVGNSFSSSATCPNLPRKKSRTWSTTIPLGRWNVKTKRNTSSHRTVRIQRGNPPQCIIITDANLWKEFLLAADRSIECSHSAGPTRSSSTGFSLCGFGYCVCKNAHRLKPVLQKPLRAHVSSLRLAARGPHRLFQRREFQGNPASLDYRALTLVRDRSCGSS